MPPRKEIWDELTRIWGQAEPVKADPPATPRSKLNRTAKIILKTASITSVITTLIIAASVITAFTFINSSRNQPNARPPFNVDQSTLNTISEYLLAYQKNIQGEPIGRISSHQISSSEDNIIKISGYTKNIPEGYHVVLAVDVERLRLCWPKKPFIHPNTAFRIEIIEEGPEGECTVGLYAVDEQYYQRIKHWMSEGRFGGMPLIPMRYRLDEVKLLVRVG